MTSLLLTTYGRAPIITVGGSSPWHWASPASTPPQEESTLRLAMATWNCSYQAKLIMINYTPTNSTFSIQYKWCDVTCQPIWSLFYQHLCWQHIICAAFYFVDYWCLNFSSLLMLPGSFECCYCIFPQSSNTHTLIHAQTSQGPTTASAGG